MNFNLKNYNNRQSAAIQHCEGPLLVISGAGTGKTHLLTGKILYLLLEKGIAFDEILALTFTEKATEEMVQRIDEALPIGHPDIWIKTFHAFCDSVLQERGHEIGIPMDYKIIGDADLWMFLKKHLTDFNLDYYRPLGNPQKFLSAMQEHFARLKDEDIKPEEYILHSKNMLSKAKNEEEKEFAKKHLELGNAYNLYEDLLMKNGYMDFGGLLYYTLRLFEKRKSVLAEYQKRFKYILVDEFQDTNFAQNKIVTLLAQKHKNITVVGDDDQSIYKWRGASLTNIQYFQKNFPEAKNVVLNENYRSGQELLDMAYSVIKNNPNRLETLQAVDKKLIAKRGKAKNIIPQIYHFEQMQEEVNFIINKAAAASSSGLNTAILVRTNALANPFLESLQRERLPYQHFSPTSFFTKPGIKDCMALLRVIANPCDNVALFRFISLKFFGIPMDDILEITQKAKKNNSFLFGFLTDARFEKIKNLISDLIEYSREHAVSEVTGKFLNDSNYLKNAAEQARKNPSFQNLQILDDIALFSQKISDFESKNQHKQVSDFLEYAFFAEEAGEGRQSAEMPDPALIKVLTIHGAKGLQFDTVFVPGVVAGKFPATSRKDPFEIPEELIKEKLPTGNHHMEEERRLFYVACTRAKQFLVLTYSNYYDGKKKWKPSPFILESLESGKAASNKSKKIKWTKKQQALPFLESKSKSAQIIPPRLSYSQINTFNTCPLKYQYQYIFKIPEPPAGSANFGTSIHNTLKHFYEELKKHPELLNKNLLPLLLKIFEENWISSGYESRELEQDQKRLGEILIEKFYNAERKNIVIPEFIEKAFELKIKNVSLTGKIDRIDKLPDGTYEVIDYKTGKQKENLAKDLQLSIYALACRDFLKIPVSKLSLYFLENMEKVSEVRDEKSLEECKQKILKYVEQMEESDFPPLPGRHCSYCSFRLICPAAAPITR